MTSSKKIIAAVSLVLILLIGVFFVRTRQNSQSQPTSLYRAAFIGDATKAQEALTQGVSVDEPDASSGLTPLMIAADRGHDDVVQTLLSQGANVQATSPSGLTPLMLAASRDRTSVIQLLLAKGADVSAKNKLGRTALDMALAAKKLPSNSKNQSFEETIRLLQQAPAK